MPQLPGARDCCWTANAPATNFPSLAGEARCDTVIVGGGIVGLTAALALRDAGKSVVVLEARRVGRQVTGRSSAKITAQHALVYRHLIDTFGWDTAMAYAEANRHAVAHIGACVERFGITCDYEPKSAYAYASSREGNDAIGRECEAARSLGFEARVHEHAPLPFPTAAALEFPHQAQFNPASYLAAVAGAAQALGATIYEQSRATSFDFDGNWHIGTGAGSVTAESVVIATNITVKSPVGYATRTQPRCHVAMAYRARTPLDIDGMFIGVEEPTHSIRTGRDAGGPIVLVLGPRFDTGHDGDVAHRFRELDEWARAHLHLTEPLWRWCNEDYETADRMPYVGQPDAAAAPGFYVATGFNAWGISNGAAAGLMIASDIATGTHPWGELYDPTRSAPEDFHQSGDTQSQVDDVSAIAAGEGGIVERGGEKLAVWRHEQGELHAVSAACTHKGCTVTWNNADRTWDCPCHGSVFECGGAVIHGPARKALAPREL